MRQILIILTYAFIKLVTSTPTENDIAIMTSQHINNMIHNYNFSASTLNLWQSSLNSSGLWPNIDMTSGCNARTANWPATAHLTRTRALAAAYASHPTSTLLSIINLALEYWFAHDFTEPDCFDRGGRSGYNCPCGTPGLWNKNWFQSTIAVPKMVGDICLLIKDKLTPTQSSNCTHIQARAYTDTESHPLSRFTGANMLDVASVGIALGLFTENADTVQDALEHFYGAVSIVSKATGDGIQPDGSFMQHAGLLYNGNYGKDFINDLISVFIETKGTSVAPDNNVQSAFDTLLDGTEWMIIGDTRLKKLLWQHSTIGRMVSFKYSDGQASGGVAIDIAGIEEGVEGWKIKDEINEITGRLQQPTTKTANQGDLVGTRYFYNADYLVHRTPTFVVTFKMYSSRTVNSECVNTQNPFGFHLSDGAIYNYLTGDEYVDVFGAWDWNLVPGITVDYDGTPLACNTVKTKGNSSFVGAATDGNTGIAVFDYVNPINRNLAFKKTVFFFPSGYAVQVGPVTLKNTSSPLVTVLDQRRRNGDIYINGAIRNTDESYTTKAKSVWHDRIGYYFPSEENIYVDSKPKASNWSTIGISTGTRTEQLWTSYINHPTATTTGLLTQYIVQPDVDADTFTNRASNGKMPFSLNFSSSAPQVNAAYSIADKSIAVAFWTKGTYISPWGVTFESNSPCVLLFRLIDANTSRHRLTVSDPSQLLKTINLKITVNGTALTKTITLPTGVEAGKAVVSSLMYSNK